MTIRVVWIDTAPLIDKYRNEKETYPDACKQDYQQQLAWIDSVLTSAKEDWIIVAGHHPIYAETPKDESERLDMQARLDPILRKHKSANKKTLELRMIDKDGNVLHTVTRNK